MHLDMLAAEAIETGETGRAAELAAAEPMASAAQRRKRDMCARDCHNPNAVNTNVFSNTDRKLICHSSGNDVGTPNPFPHCTRHSWSGPSPI